MSINIEQFCTCSSTYKQYKQAINPYPQNENSILAIEELIKSLIAPITNYYGIENFDLNYGFSSMELIKFLKRKNPITGQKNGRICPKIDQHAAHEINRHGDYICKHLGAACDFQIKNVNSKEVITWIKSNLNFDSIYFYGSDRPIHISYAPHNRRAIWTFTPQNTPIKFKP